MTPMPLSQLRDFLRRHLLQDVIPFWMNNAIDARGGINTCITDEGRLISDEKFMWSQLRAIYVFSALYNRIEPRPEWLDIAQQIYTFCRRHGRNEKGEWLYRLAADGRPLDGAKSIYVDGFALQGLAEYIRATGDAGAKRLAIETFQSVEARLRRGPQAYESFPYPIPEGLKAHGISMIFSFGMHETATATGDARIAAAALEHAEQVMHHFRRPEKQALVEFVRLDGSLEDSPPGRSIVYGHGIESMWFQIHQFEQIGQLDRIPQCLDVIRWLMEKGWDSEYGGLYHAGDIDGQLPYWRYPDAKLWWPQTEAIYALLKAHTITGESWCLDWYWKVHEIAFRHYPVPVHGEWTQRLDRRFNRITDVIALPVKDPFHLPRALILSVEALSSQADRRSPTSRRSEVPGQTSPPSTVP